MKQQPKYNWETQHDTAAKTMTHTFSKRVQVVSNIKNGEIQVLIDGHIVNTYYSLPVKHYEALLLATEEYAYELQRKDLIKATLAKVAVYVLMAIGILALFALGGDNDEWSLAQFTVQKATCIAVMASCFYGVKCTPVLAAAWNEIDNNIKE